MHRQAVLPALVLRIAGIKFANTGSMELDEYSDLSLGEKADILWKRGLFIENYCDRSVTVNLYFIFDFFVEVVVLHNTFRIKEISAFRDGPRLEKYLQNISLRELLSSA